MTGPDPSPQYDDGVVPRTDRGLTEAGDRGHREYVEKQIHTDRARLAEAATQLDKIRNPRDWQDRVDWWGDRQLLHDSLMHGYQVLNGRTEAQGWRQEFGQKTGLGWRRHDNALVVDRAGQQVVKVTTEFKAGYVDPNKGIRQLQKERLLLSSGKTKGVSEYVIRAAHPPDKLVMREAQQLAKDFPGKFTIIELSEREFERYVEAGREIVKAKVVEKLGHLIEKVRQSPELQTAPRAIEGFIKEVEKAHERGQPIGLEVLVGSRVELANLLQVDGRITREADKAAREAAQLRLKEAQIVEHVQAQQRAERHERLSQMLARVDREIVTSAAAVVRAQVPVKAPGKALELPTAGDPTRAAMAKSMADMAKLIQHRDNVRASEAERAVLDRVQFPTAMHREVTALVLAQQRETGAPVTAERVAAAEQQVRERVEREQQAVRAVQARDVRERENRELMQRIADRHNKALEQAGREQSAARGDRAQDAVRARHYPQLAKDLRLDPKQLAEKGIDAQVVAAIAWGEVRVDEAARAYVVDGKYVSRDSQEVAVAKQIQQVEQSMDLELVKVRQLIDKGHEPTRVASSREDLERQRAEMERQRQLARERHGDGRTVGERGREGPERGQARAR